MGIRYASRLFYLLLFREKASRAIFQLSTSLGLLAGSPKKDKGKDGIQSQFFASCSQLKHLNRIHRKINSYLM